MLASFSEKVRGISVCFARLNVMTFHRRVSPSTPPIWQHLSYKQAGMYATPTHAFCNILFGKTFLSSPKIARGKIWEYEWDPCAVQKIVSVSM